MATMAPRARALKNERLFYLGMASAILVAIFIGFAPSFYVRGAVQGVRPLLPLTPLVLTHGLLFTSWVLLFMTQVGLVSAGRVDLHRKLGQIGIFVLAAMIVVGTLAALGGVARHSGRPDVPPLSFLAIPLLDVPVFTTLFCAGLYNRRTPQTHKRLMLIGMISMLIPAFGRMPWPPSVPFPIVIFGVYGVFLGALATWDVVSRGRVHKATILGGGFLIGSWVFRLAIMNTAAWLAFAEWASRLVR